VTLRQKLAITAGSVIVVVALLVWLLAFSPVFGVHSVKITGLHALTRGQVSQAAEIPHDRPLLRLDTSAVRARVAALPEVESVSVSTSWPNGVIIAITERVPVGYVSSGSGFGLVDKTGKQYTSVRTRPTTYPRLELAPGEDTAARATDAAIAAVATALPSGLRAEVASISALDPGSVELALDDGRSVRWGSADRDADKARVLAALVGQKAARDVGTIDVTDPDLPYTH